MNKFFNWRQKLLSALLRNKSEYFLQRKRVLPFLTAPMSSLLRSLDVRDKLQRLGINIVPANFYSTIPTVAEIRNSFEYGKNGPPYHNPSLFDANHLRTMLETLKPYADEFTPPQQDDETNPSGFFWNNSQFSHSDAMAYYAMVRHIKPRRILEIGSGFSTLVASQALCKNGFGEIICIEPFPRPFLHQTPGIVQLIQQPVQNIGIDFFQQNLRDGDILFIDSTHTVKCGSDCLYLYLKVLPSLHQRLMIHVHDVFLPEAMPQEWALSHHIYWTEQYLLLAYLLDNSLVRVCFGSNYHRIENTNSLEGFMQGKAEAGGGSFWFERTPA